MPSVFVVFSSTPFKMGAFIRAVTRAKYNHVSVAFDSELSETYSFARLYRNTPFCGGFVRETQERFTNGKGDSQIKICEIKVEDEQLEGARAFIEEMKANRENFVYNFLSAAAYMIKKKVSLPHAYTCLEFVSETLKRAGLPVLVKNGSFLTISGFAEMLDPLTVYEGSYRAYVSNINSATEQLTAPNFLKRLTMTVASNAKLLTEAFKTLISPKRPAR